MTSIKIKENSIVALDISDEEYFSSKYKEYCSNSRLTLVNPNQEGSIEKYLKNDHSGYSSSFEFGSAIHARLLQPNDFIISSCNCKPTGKLGTFVDSFIKFRQSGLSIYKAVSKE